MRALIKAVGKLVVVLDRHRFGATALTIIVVAVAIARHAG